MFKTVSRKPGLQVFQKLKVFIAFKEYLLFSLICLCSQNIFSIFIKNSKDLFQFYNQCLKYDIHVCRAYSFSRAILFEYCIYKYVKRIELIPIEFKVLRSLKADFPC
jgi:hypothetical protein